MNQLPAAVARRKAEGNALHFVLRVSDSLRDVDTHAQHAGILRGSKKVWLGKWGASCGAWSIAVAKEQLAASIPTYLYLRIRGETKYRCKLKDVAGPGLAPARDLVPEYYRDERCGIWFLISKIETCDLTEEKRLMRYLEWGVSPNFNSQVGIHYVTSEP